MSKPFFETVDPAQQAKERRKARELRSSQWWKQQIGRGICYFCGGHFPKDQLTMDHVIPISRGGRSNKKNVVVCCKACNNKKKNLTQFDLTMQEIERQK